jgi:hypothetical protein
MDKTSKLDLIIMLKIFKNLNKFKSGIICLKNLLFELITYLIFSIFSLINFIYILIKLVFIVKK